MNTEDMIRAGGLMQSAADDMKQAVLNLEGTLERHRYFMEQWLQTFEAVLTENKP